MGKQRDGRDFRTPRTLIALAANIYISRGLLLAGIMFDTGARAESVATGRYKCHKRVLLVYVRVYPQYTRIMQ